MIILILSMTAALILTALIFDNGVLATVLLALGFVATGLFSGFINMINAVVHNPTKSLLYCSAYVVVGVVWMVFRWTLFVHKAADKERLLKEWADNNGGCDRYGTKFRANKILVSDHKASLFKWWFYWPFSLLDYFCRDFVRKVFDAIYRKLKDALQGISDRAFKDL